MSTHGCALINMIFTLPHSAVVECDPPYFYETYYPHSTHDALYLEAEKAYMEGTFEEIHRKFIYMNVYSKQFSVISAVEDAIEYVRRWRYVYETNDYWSPLFLSVV